MATTPTNLLNFWDQQKMLLVEFHNKQNQLTYLTEFNSPQIPHCDLWTNFCDDDILLLLLAIFVSRMLFWMVLVFLTCLKIENWISEIRLQILYSRTPSTITRFLKQINIWSWFSSDLIRSYNKLWLALEMQLQYICSCAYQMQSV